MPRYRNPQNGYEEHTDGVIGFICAFLFGPLYFLVKGCFGHAIIYVIIVFCLAFAWPLIPFVWLGYAIAAPGIVRRQYLRKGWVEVRQPAV